MCSPMRLALPGMVTYCARTRQLKHAYTGMVHKSRVGLLARPGERSPPLEIAGNGRTAPACAGRRPTLPRYPHRPRTYATAFHIQPARGTIVSHSAVHLPHSRTVGVAYPERPQFAIADPQPHITPIRILRQSLHPTGNRLARFVFFP